MKILGVSRSTICHGILGGMEASAHDLYSGLVEKGLEVKVVTTNFGDEDRLKIVDGVQYISIRETPSGVYSREFKDGLKNFINNEVEIGNFFPDIIHSTSAAAEPILNNKYKIPVIATWHGTDFDKILNDLSSYVYVDKKVLLPKHFNEIFINFFKRLRRNNFANYDSNVVISRYMLDVFDLYGAEKNRVNFVPNCVPNYFYEDKFERVKSNKVTLGIVGRMVPAKGGFVIADALKGLEKNDYSFVIAGEGGDFGKIYDAGFDVEKVKVSRKEMPSVYKKIDVLLNPTLTYTGFDLTVQEALLCGCRVVVSDLPQYVYFFESLREKFGQNIPVDVFRIGDGSSLLGSINRVLKRNVDPSVIDYFKEIFSRKKMIDEYIDIFKSMNSK